MKEVFLYVCDICDTVKMNYRDVGSAWCVMCQACRECQFHSKIELRIKSEYPMFPIFMLEEKKDVNTSTGDAQED